MPKARGLLQRKMQGVQLGVGGVAPVFLATHRPRGLGCSVRLENNPEAHGTFFETCVGPEVGRCWALLSMDVLLQSGTRMAGRTLGYGTHGGVLSLRGIVKSRMT